MLIAIRPLRAASLPLFHARRSLLLLAGLLPFAGSGVGASFAAETAAQRWEVPLEGNSYLTRPASEPEGGRRRGGGGGGGNRWQDPESVRSVFFRIDRPATLDLGLKARLADGESTIRATVNGKPLEVTLKPTENGEHPLGQVAVQEAGYVRIDLQGLKKSGAVFAEPQAVTISAGGEAAAALQLNYVRDNEGNRFYWGRRGPSVHLGYTLPQGEPTEWFYNEVTVPEGEDPIGSYFMANGFGEGYFGMQVNGEQERRILFSVWSPFSTDRPHEIPEDQKIVLLGKGEGVHGGEFGGEGSGGQSYWLYPWKAGNTYRFLNRVKPDGQGATVYSAWFFLPESQQWKLIASFKRPKTDTHLRGAHSFLENFSDRNGYLGRKAFYGNQWACDIKGAWHEITEARFTGDDIANRGYRLDYAGGGDQTRFYLRNGGYFADSVKLGSRFKRESSGAKAPEIDFAKLEGNTPG